MGSWAFLPWGGGEVVSSWFPSPAPQQLTVPALPCAATNLCFAERNVYTSEVLAVVMQQLMEQNPLPMLLMRTVIQSLTMYPRLGGFVMNILSRLILKQVQEGCGEGLAVAPSLPLPLLGPAEGSLPRHQFALLREVLQGLY